MSQLPQSSAEPADLMAALKEIEKATGFLVVSITCVIHKPHLPSQARQCCVVLAWVSQGSQQESTLPCMKVFPSLLLSQSEDNKQ